MTKLSDVKQGLLVELQQNLGTVVTRKQVLTYVKGKGGTVADVRFIFNNKQFRAGRGQYDLSGTTSSVTTTTTTTNTATV